MSIVAAHGIQKAYGPDVVLRSADVIIDPGQRVGMVGKNGAGKSTLARILAGTEAPDAGQVARRRGALILHLDQVPRFEGDPTAREGAAQGLSAWNAAMAAHEALSARLAEGGADLERLLEEQARVSEEIERLGGFDQAHRVASMLGHLGIRDIDRRLSTLSGGEQRRVALARALIARADLTILDEPTNHLDAETVEWLEQYLIDEHAGAVLLITHDRYLLDRVAERTLEVADGEVFSYDGGYELYLEQKAERLAHAARTEQNRQNFVRRELEWLRRQPKARTTKQKARIERAEAAIAVQAPKGEKTHTFELDVARSGKTILETRGLAVEINGRTLIKNLEMFLTEGDRIGVVGPNGIGKTTLLKTLLGEREPNGGKVVLGQNTKVAYFDQQRSGLENDKSIFENIGNDQSRIQIGGEVMDPRTYLERFGFDSHKQRQPVGSLSGGERARVALAKMLRQAANLVVMDEPTNDLDVSTLGALESMLVELGATALVVTHDRWFLDRVATAILAFEGDGRVALYPGNYESFRRLSAEARAQRASQPDPAADKPKAEPSQRPGAKKKAALSRAEEKELAGAPDAIERAEQQVSALEQKLADPSTYSASGTDVPRLVAELDAAKAEVTRLMARWEELEAKKQG
jgi:ATP-binding cassette subfamily F protein uup